MEAEKCPPPKDPDRSHGPAPGKPHPKSLRAPKEPTAAGRPSRAKPPRGGPPALFRSLSLRPAEAAKRAVPGLLSPKPRGVPSSVQTPTRPQCPLPQPAKRLHCAEGAGKQWVNAPMRGGKKRAAAQRPVVVEEEKEEEAELVDTAKGADEVPSECSSVNSSINDGGHANHAQRNTSDPATGYLANTDANLNGKNENDNSDSWPRQNDSEGFVSYEEAYIEAEEDVNTPSFRNPIKYSTREVNECSTPLKAKEQVLRSSPDSARTPLSLPPCFSPSGVSSEEQKCAKRGVDGHDHCDRQANEHDNESAIANEGISRHADGHSPRLWSNLTRSLPEGLSAKMCETMSLYDAFYLDRERDMWLVNDTVLRRCFDFVGLMGYDRLIPGDLSPEPSPRPENKVPGLPRGDAIPPSPIFCNNFTESSPTPASVLSADTEINRRWCLTQAVSSVPLSAERWTLLLSGIEAERWISEQEYVIGAILSCCAWAQDNADEPYLVPHWHPILQTAAFVLHKFPHWGKASDFMNVWEKQVGLVLGTAAPAHQRQFAFPADGIIFSSDMESGNLVRVERLGDVASQPAFDLWMNPDMGCEQRLWFRFAIAGVRPGGSVYLRIGNIQPNTKLYLRNGMRPVWRAGGSMNEWTPVPQCTYRTINGDADGEITFVITPRTAEVVHVAFCVPYTYGDLLCHISHWHYLVKRNAYGIRFEERVLCYTQDGRKLHLLVITSLSSKNISTRAKRRANEGLLGHQQTHLGPYTNFDNGKKVVLLSGRVHPGEVTASHGIHGAITFLLSRDPCAALLRENFVFYVVPMLNPDGVSRGHSRLDQNGLNLNRCYNNPNPQIHPTVNALRKVFEHLQQTFHDRFFVYIDFHSHASQSSGFIFGNCLPASVQHWNMLFPRIVSLHAKDVFSYQSCRFGRGHMITKEGSSRVLFGGSLIHSYTIELTHFTNNRMYVDGDPDPSGGAGTAADSDGRWEAKYANTSGPRKRHSTAAPSHSRFVRSRQKPSAHPHARLRGASAVGPKRRAAKAGPGTGEADALRIIDTPCILSQSAEVGRACLMALVDYCAIATRASPAYAMYGGSEKALREISRQIGAPVSMRPDVHGAQFICKPY